MKIVKTEDCVVTFIETDENGWNNYTRYGEDSWTVQMGESDESVYDCEELEQLYQDYVKSQNGDKMKFCPFCGYIDNNFEDSLYPTATVWKESERGKYYGSRENLSDYNGEIWNYCCGQCDATLYGDSKEDVIQKWNERK